MPNYIKYRRAIIISTLIQNSLPQSNYKGASSGTSMVNKVLIGRKRRKRIFGLPRALT